LIVNLKENESPLAELTAPDVLRVGINLGNSLLVSGTNPSGDPQGVAPDLAAALAKSLGVAVKYLTYPMPGDVADAGERDEWDICLIAIEPKRAEKIDFSDAYAEIEATYLVPKLSPFQSIEEVDQPGVRIATLDRAAYDLYLTRTLKHAELNRFKDHSEAFDRFVEDKMNALAGLAPGLQKSALMLPGSRVLDGCYTAVRQSIGTKRGNKALSAVIESFISEIRARGLVADLIDHHGVIGKLQVAT